METLDKLDYRILEELQRDGRITVTELANSVGLSITPCKLRMKKLKEAGVIVGYTALVDHAKLNLNHVAFVQVTLNNTNTKALDEFNQAARHIPEIEQCHMIAGNFDYLLKVRTSDVTQFREVLGNKISVLPHVQQSSSYVSMENVKDPGL